MLTYAISCIIIINTDQPLNAMSNCLLCLRIYPQRNFEFFNFKKKVTL